MKATDIQVKAFITAFHAATDAPRMTPYEEAIRQALQTVFDFHVPLKGIDEEPTIEQVNRAHDVFVNHTGSSIDASREALRAAMNEPAFPYAISWGPNQVMLYFSRSEKFAFDIPPFMEFDFETFTIRLKK